MTDSKEAVEFDCVMLNETPKAFKIELLIGKKKREQWVPKSISEVTGTKKGMKIHIQRWFCEKENLL